MSIIHVPIEIIALIAKDLGLDDLFNLGLSCRHFRYLLETESVCRSALQVSASYPPLTFVSIVLLK